MPSTLVLTSLSWWAEATLGIPRCNSSVCENVCFISYSTTLLSCPNNVLSVWVCRFACKNGISARHSQTRFSVMRFHKRAKKSREKKKERLNVYWTWSLLHRTALWAAANKSEWNISVSEISVHEYTERKHTSKGRNRARSNEIETKCKHPPPKINFHAGIYGLPSEYLKLCVG